RIEKKPNHKGHRLPILIMDGHGKQIYHYRMSQVQPDDSVQRILLGPSDREYQIFSKKPQPPRIYKQVLYRFQTLQFGFIFLASALVSALLSWSIVRPINYLGAFSRRYANQQEIATLPKKLLARGDELADLAADIDFMVNKTHAAASTQQQLLHDVSHELRAPLARLQASAALIEQKNPDNRHTKQINNDCMRIDQLIQQILNYSKLEHYNSSPQQCDLNALCQQVVDNMAVSFPGTGIHFASSDTVEITGYPEPLLQALDNIVGNACKYSPAGQVVDITITEHENTVKIAVRDHGPSVDESEMSKLLQPFYRGGNQMHTSGFGLGLSIALKAINKHKGELRMSKPADGGLSVSVILPYTLA
ncbi:MAG: two-component system OmpR family sensor kinase, partial [Paraglaciecola sp.]